MKVILLKNIEKLGSQAEIVNVKRGFARNYLIPRDLAIYATPQNMKKLGSLQAKAAEEEEKRLAVLKKLAEKINSLNLVFIRKVDENDHMFGSVSEADIVSALAENSVEIHKSAVQLEKHIKELGISQVQIKLHRELVAVLKIDVQKEAREETSPKAEVLEPLQAEAEPVLDEQTEEAQNEAFSDESAEQTDTI